MKTRSTYLPNVSRINQHTISPRNRRKPWQKKK